MSKSLLEMIKNIHGFILGIYLIVSTVESLINEHSN